MEGLDGAIRKQVADAEAELNRLLGDEAETTLKHLFPRLVSVSPEGIATRQRVLRTNLTEAETRAVRVLEARRLLTGESDGAEGAGQGVSVAHERLFKAWPHLKTWIDNSQGQLIELRRAEHAAALWASKHHALAYQWPLEQLRGLQQAIDAFPQLPHSERLRAFARPQLPLIRRLERPEVTHRERDDIGKLLAELGDPRPGVGLRPDGLPDIVWVPVPRGAVRLEYVDHDFKVQPFEIARYPVTHAQFQAFIDAPDGWHNDDWWIELTRPDAPGEACWPLPNHPRENVDWNEAMAFCRWLDTRWRSGAEAETKSLIRLPTEWEWQQAATGGDPENIYPWGPEWDTKRANSYEGQIRRTTAVGMYPLGTAALKVARIMESIEDLSGNVWEWCLNQKDDPAKPSALKVDRSGAARALRGGAWDYDSGTLRAAFRDGYNPAGRDSNVGFRVCRVSPIGKAARRRR